MSIHITLVMVIAWMKQIMKDVLMMVVIVVDLMLIQHIVLNVYAINTFDILLNKTKHATTILLVYLITLLITPVIKDMRVRCDTLQGV